MGVVKLVLKRAIGLLPDNSLVGFILYGTQVQVQVQFQVYELSFSDISKVYVFQGSKEIAKEHILDQLGLGSTDRRPVVGGYQPWVVQNVYPYTGINRFLLPASDCEYTLNSVGILLGSCVLDD